MDNFFFDQAPSVFDQFELLVFNLLFVTVDAVRAGSYLLAPAVGLGLELLWAVCLLNFSIFDFHPIWKYFRPNIEGGVVESITDPWCADFTDSFGDWL